MSLTESTDAKYLKIREKAYNIEKNLESAEEQYKEQLMKIIQKIQAEFYKKYGNQVQELQDLTEVIEQYKYQGIKNLKKELNKLYIENLVQAGGDLSKENYKDKQEKFKIKSKELYNQYKIKYCPEDNYQKKRNEEAKKLQKAILGLNIVDDEYENEHEINDSFLKL